MPAARFTTLSLFTGAGGLDCGFERTGRFELVAAVEKVPEFCESLRLNHAAGRFGTADTKIVEADLGLLDPQVLMEKLGIDEGDIDVLIGGPPCQTFSTAGRRRTVQDPRGELLWSFLDFVAAVRPRVFVMENVRGLLSAALSHRPIAQRPDKGGPPLLPEEKPGSVVEAWLSDLSIATEGAYRVDCFEVNAVNYGAPQLRERVMLIGNSEGKAARWPEPTHGPGRIPFATLGDALANVPPGIPLDVLDFSPRKKRYLEQVPPGGNWRMLPEPVQRESMGRAWHAKGGRSGWWRKLSRSLPSPTVVTMPNHASTSMCHPDEVRALSVAEYAAIQEFPPGWELAGTTQAKYQQIGNAVPVRLGSIAASVVVDVLTDSSEPDDSLPRYRRQYVDSHVRTRRWFENGAAVGPPDTPTPEGESSRR